MEKIFVNGKIATMEKNMPLVEAVVTSNGKIIFAGSNEKALKYQEPTAQVIDLKGRLMVPGFIDSHIHLLNLGYSMQNVDLSGAMDLNEEGEPNGIFRENAISMVYGKVPKNDVKSIKEMLLSAQEKASSFGITSIKSDDLQSAPGLGFKEVILAYKELVSEGKIKIRLYEQCQLTDMEELKSFFDKRYFSGWGDEHFKLGPLKILTDGSLGARTAYMTLPYEDAPGNYGICTYGQEELDELVAYAHKNGRHSIIHCQITDEKLLDRFEELDAIAHVQPIFLDYDLHIVEERIGKERAKWTYNWKSLIDRGVHVAFGSDCPVEPCHVIHGIYAAVTRKDLKGYPDDGWLPDQKVSVEEALYGFTMGSAYAPFEEDIKGSIKAGKLADFTVLSEDIFEIEPDKLKDVEVIATIVNGEIIWCSS